MMWSSWFHFEHFTPAACCRRSTDRRWKRSLPFSTSANWIPADGRSSMPITLHKVQQWTRRQQKAVHEQTLLCFWSASINCISFITWQLRVTAGHHPSTHPEGWVQTDPWNGLRHRWTTTLLICLPFQSWAPFQTGQFSMWTITGDIPRQQSLVHVGQPKPVPDKMWIPTNFIAWQPTAIAAGAH